MTDTLTTWGGWASAVRDDPFGHFAKARARCPVQRVRLADGHLAWVVLGYDAARQALNDPRISKDMLAALQDNGDVVAGGLPGPTFSRHMLNVDPPDHTRLRRLLTPEFTMRRLQRLRPGVEEIIGRQLDEIASAAAAGGPVDLVPTFAFPIPFLVICDLLGLPDEKRETFSQLATARFDVTGGGAGTVGAIGGSREFLLAEAARQRTNPGPGLIGQIIREHGDEISDFELGGLADGVFTGGLETSASMLALGTAVLLERRELWNRLIADPTTAGPVVDELLRLLSVVQVAFPRFAKQDVEVGGHHIAQGSIVLCSLPAANRDPRSTSGDEMDLARANGSHLAFGHGFHRCIGAELARMELKMAFPAIAARFPEMRLAVPREELDYRALSIVYGVEAVPVHVGADGRAVG